MSIVKFDCNSHCSPAYTCNKPGDNSGSYVKVEDLKQIIEKYHSDAIKKLLSGSNSLAIKGEAQREIIEELKLIIELE